MCIYSVFTNEEDKVELGKVKVSMDVGPSTVKCSSKRQPEETKKSLFTVVYLRKFGII